MFFYKLLNFFYNDRILGQAGRKIRESVGSISRGPTPDLYHLLQVLRTDWPPVSCTLWPSFALTSSICSSSSSVALWPAISSWRAILPLLDSRYSTWHTERGHKVSESKSWCRIHEHTVSLRFLAYWSFCVDFLNHREGVVVSYKSYQVFPCLLYSV